MSALNTLDGKGKTVKARGVAEDERRCYVVCVCVCLSHVPLSLSYKILLFYIGLISWVLESDFLDSYLSSATLRFVWP